jgi:hypothetical protein
MSPGVESGGSCTLVLSRGGRIVTVTTKAQPDATTTNCGNLVVGRNKLEAGSWSAVLRYSSPTARGVSEPATVEVPR